MISSARQIFHTVQNLSSKFRRKQRRTISRSHRNKIKFNKAKNSWKLLAPPDTTLSDEDHCNCCVETEFGLNQRQFPRPLDPAMKNEEQNDQARAPPPYFSNIICYRNLIRHSSVQMFIFVRALLEVVALLTHLHSAVKKKDEE